MDEGRVHSKVRAKAATEKLLLIKGDAYNQNRFERNERALSSKQESWKGVLNEKAFVKL